MLTERTTARRGRLCDRRRPSSPLAMPVAVTPSDLALHNWHAGRLLNPLWRLNASAPLPRGVFSIQPETACDQSRSRNPFVEHSRKQYAAPELVCGRCLMRHAIDLRMGLHEATQKGFHSINVTGLAPSMCMQRSLAQDHEAVLMRLWHAYAKSDDAGARRHHVHRSVAQVHRAGPTSATSIATRDRLYTTSIEPLRGNLASTPLTTRTPPRRVSRCAQPSSPTP